MAESVTYIRITDSKDLGRTEDGVPGGTHKLETIGGGYVFPACNTIRFMADPQLPMNEFDE